jgi:hypothetical protein
MCLAGRKHAHYWCLHFLELEGLRKLHIGCNKVVDCLVLLDQHIGKVSSNAVIWHAWCYSSAALAPNTASSADMLLMLRILANVAIQWVF